MRINWTHTQTTVPDLSISPVRFFLEHSLLMPSAGAVAISACSCCSGGCTCGSAGCSCFYGTDK